MGFNNPTISSRNKNSKGEGNTCNNASYNNVSCEVLGALNEHVFKHNDVDVKKATYKEGKSHDKIGKLNKQKKNKQEQEQNLYEDQKMLLAEQQVLDKQQQKLYNQQQQKFLNEQFLRQHEIEEENVEDAIEPELVKVAQVSETVKEEERKSPVRKRLYRTISTQKKVQQTASNRTLNSQNSFKSFKNVQPPRASRNDMNFTQSKPDFNNSLKSVTENKENIYEKKKLLIQKYRGQTFKKRSSSESKFINTVGVKNVSDKVSMERQMMEQKIRDEEESQKMKERIEKERKVKEKLIEDAKKEIEKDEQEDLLEEDDEENESQNEKEDNEEGKSSKWSEDSVLKEVVNKTPTYRLNSNKPSVNQTCLTPAKHESEKKEQSENIATNMKKTQDNKAERKRDRNQLKDKLNPVSDVEEVSFKENLNELSSNNKMKTNSPKSTLENKRAHNGYHEKNLKDKSSKENYSILTKTSVKTLDNIHDKTKQSKFQKKSSSKCLIQDKEMTEKIEDIEKWIDNSLPPNKQKEEEDVIENNKEALPQKNSLSSLRVIPTKKVKKPLEIKKNEENSKATEDKTEKSSEINKKETSNKKECKSKSKSKSKKQKAEMEATNRQTNVLPLSTHSFLFEETKSKSDLFTFNNLKSKLEKKEKFNVFKDEPVQSKQVTKQPSEPSIASSSSDSGSDSTSQSDSAESEEKEIHNENVLENTRKKSNEILSFNENRFFKPVGSNVEGNKHKALKFTEIHKNANIVEESIKDDETCKADSISNSSSLNEYLKETKSNKKNEEQTKRNKKEKNMMLKKNKSNPHIERVDKVAKHDTKSFSVTRKIKRGCENVDSSDEKSVKCDCKDKNNNQKNESEYSNSEDESDEDTKSEKGLLTMIKKIRNGRMTPRTSFQCLTNMVKNKGKKASKQSKKVNPLKQINQPQETIAKEITQPQKIHQTRNKFQETTVNESTFNSDVSLKIKENIQKMKNKKEQVEENKEQNTMKEVEHMNNSNHLYSNQFVQETYDIHHFEPQVCQYSLPSPQQLPQQLPQQPPQQNHHVCCWTLPPLPVKLLPEPGMNGQFNDHNEQNYQNYNQLNHDSLIYSEPIIDQALENSGYMLDKNYTDWNVVPPCHSEVRWDQNWYQKENQAHQQNIQIENNLFNNNNQLSKNQMENNLMINTNHVNNTNHSYNTNHVNSNNPIQNTNHINNPLPIQNKNNINKTNHFSPHQLNKLPNQNTHINNPNVADRTFQMPPDYTMYSKQQSDSSHTYQPNYEPGEVSCTKEYNEGLSKQCSSISFDIPTPQDIPPLRKERENRITFSSLSKNDLRTHAYPRKGNSIYSYEFCLDDPTEQSSRLAASCRPSNTSNRLKSKMPFDENRENYEPGECNKDPMCVKKSRSKISDFRNAPFAPVKRNATRCGSCLSISTIKSSDSHKAKLKSQTDDSAIRVGRRAIRM